MKFIVRFHWKFHLKASLEPRVEGEVGLLTWRRNRVLFLIVCHTQLQHTVLGVPSVFLSTYSKLKQALCPHENCCVNKSEKHSVKPACKANVHWKFTHDWNPAPSPIVQTTSHKPPPPPHPSLRLENIFCPLRGSTQDLGYSCQSYQQMKRKARKTSKTSFDGSLFSLCLKFHTVFDWWPDFMRDLRFLHRAFISKTYQKYW